VDVLPADAKGAPVLAGAPDPAGNAVAWSCDLAELLDVNVDELARPLLLVAVGRLERLQPRELAEPDPGQDPRNRRGWHSQRLGDLNAAHPQPPQDRDQREPLLAASQRHSCRSGGTIEQTLLALDPIPAPPLRDRAHAHAGGRGHRRERPPLHVQPIDR